MIIMGITNRKLCINLYEQINKIAKSKLDYLIIREKDLDNIKLAELVLEIKRRLKNTNIKIIINTNVEIAKQTNADGIQLSFKNFIEMTSGSYTGNTKKYIEIDDHYNKSKKYEIYKLIGVSIHSFEEGIEAYKLGADYLLYGHVFETDCKKDISPRGTKDIEKLSKNIDIPIIGIGGISKDNFGKVINSGADGIAIMSSLMKDKNPKELIEAMF